MLRSPPTEVTIFTVLNVPVRVPGSSRMCGPPLINTGAGPCRSVVRMVVL
jgi:hypothetical protein